MVFTAIQQLVELRLIVTEEVQKHANGWTLVSDNNAWAAPRSISANLRGLARTPLAGHFKHLRSAYFSAGDGAAFLSLLVFYPCKISPVSCDARTAIWWKRGAWTSLVGVTLRV